MPTAARISGPRITIANSPTSSPIQEDIARGNRRALCACRWVCSRATRLVRDRTNNPESYDQYLRARALYRARSPARPRGHDKNLGTSCRSRSRLCTGVGTCWRGHTHWRAAPTLGVLVPRSADATVAPTKRKRPQEKPFGWIPGMPWHTRCWLTSRLDSVTSRPPRIFKSKSLALHPDDTDVLDAISNGLAIQRSRQGSREHEGKAADAGTFRARL